MNKFDIEMTLLQKKMQHLISPGRRQAVVGIGLTVATLLSMRKAKEEQCKQFYEAYEWDLTEI